MMMMVCSIFFICFLVYSYLINSKYILNSLIMLEAIMLMTMIFLIFSLSSVQESKYFFLVLLTFAACEAAIGLSLLVTFMRLRGNNFVNSLS
uniref:NADH-ubiquinone oxidoreductase chain 4L n=1 Tax=Planorbarius corneus TaxID=240818 RepID=A0A7L7SA22_9GAST|nr:NADH dehydrogenase subunit 4L [Planorbarius corneus]